MSADGRQKPRAVDHSTRQVRAALASVQARLGEWYQIAALLQGRVSRRLSNADRLKLQQKIEQVRNEIRAQRDTVILRFMDLPAHLAGHSRVLDVEKSLDRIESLLLEVEAKAFGVE